MVQWCSKGAVLLLLAAVLAIPFQMAQAAEEKSAAAASPAAKTESPGADNEALAKAAQNPIASMISVPFQSNFNFGQGPDDEMQYILNVQPVIPFSLSDDWNLITRWVTPVIYQPSLFHGMDSAFGLGDINPSFFFSPTKPAKVTWGVGPTFTFPTATDDALGSGKVSAGPTFVALSMSGPWVYGALASNQWSFAGEGGRDHVNAMVLQPFLNYNLPGGTYLTTSPIVIANWADDDSDNQWTIPVGGGVGKIMRFGKLPVNLQLSAYYNVEHPEPTGADWQLRFQIQLMFPK